MALNKTRFLFISIIAITSFSLKAFDRLPILLAKQASNNLRFISNDGKYTYYQRASGSLLLSTNYKVSEVIKSSTGTQFEIIASPARKKLILSQNEHFHHYFSLRQELSLYSLNFGETTPTLVGKGINPKLHREDSWMTYYSPSKRSLLFTNLQSSLLKFEIKLSNKINPYFIPEVVMPDDDRVLYTDLNNEGISAVIDFKRGTGKIIPFLKVNSAFQKLELCLNEKSLFIAQFGIAGSALGSSITRYPLNNLIPQEGKVIYQSERDDLGHMICNFNQEKIYFIQNKTNKNDKEVFEVVAQNLLDKTITTLSSVQFPTQILNMDGTLLLQMNGKTFILEGNNDLVKDSLPKKNETPAAVPRKTEQEDDAKE